jgi:uncharacterized membrane protein YebE (DUF533 family)
MRTRLLTIGTALGLLGLGYTAPANAVGCITGGAAGAVAGHMAHHGVLGAVGGCIAGHEYHKHHKASATHEDQRQSPQQSSQSHDQGGSKD